MLRPPIVHAVLALSFVALPCIAQADPPDTLSGPVTAITSPTAFDASGQHISLSPDAQLCPPPPHFFGTENEAQACKVRPAFTTADLFLGEHVLLSGNRQSAKHSFIANKITLRRIPENVSGTAVIDLIPAQPANSAERLVRADGYLLHITPESKLTFAPPLNALADLSTNQWIEYSGAVQRDGTILITSATISPNTDSKAEEKLRKKTDYDPSRVPYVDDMSDMTPDYLSTFYQHLGPWPNAAMQTRVQRIGESLVPAYQHSLHDSDPTKINFRFSVIDEKNLGDPMSLPSGVILVPHQLIERLQNDDQVAALLADSIAQIIEKDALAKRSIHDKVVASDLILGGILSSVVTEAAANHAYAADPSRTTRVSLCLMHDAGYDITQAPLAWWHLADKKNKPLDQVKLPARAETLYDALGIAWRDSANNAPPSSIHPPSAPSQN